MTEYAFLEDLIVETAEAVQPVDRMSVAECAERYRYIDNPGSHVGPWSNEKTPYLVEPQEVLTSRQYRAMIFVGPAQCGKTDVFFNWCSYTAIVEPADMMLIHMSQMAARDFSIRKFDRFNRHSMEVGKRLISGRNNDNTFDKRYRNGSLVTLSWPTITELSGKTLPYVWLTDYDRMPQDVDGEGQPFDLARKRTAAYKWFGMTVAESSPGFAVPIDLRNWQPRTPHEAPPATGVLSLYNRGDRRRWYWRCVVCKRAFEPRFRYLVWPDTVDIMEAAEAAQMACPHCDTRYSHSPTATLPGKMQLNAAGRWLLDGQVWNEDGSVSGKPMRSDIASFWMFGPAAAFQDWGGLVVNYLKAVEEERLTGSRAALQVTTNVDQGEPYSSAMLADARVPEALYDRRADYDMGHVPQGVRFLLAAIDVQKNVFVVLIVGFGEYGDMWIVDRFEIRKSVRLDDDGERFWITPGIFKEDWYLLIDQVITRSYPLADGSGRTMSIKLTVCDSAGREGVTTNAYEFYRHLKERADLRHLLGRFLLLKGTPEPRAPRVSISYPDSPRKDRKAGARGEVPVLLLNSNLCKDTIDARLNRDAPGGGYVAFPDDFPEFAFAELTVEVRNDKGQWVNPNKRRNETWDLLVYAYAAAISRSIGLERISWDDPPSWARDWDDNSLVWNPSAGQSERPVDPIASLAKLGAQLT